MTQNNQHEKPSLDAKYELMHARCLAIETIQNAILIDVLSEKPEPLEESRKYSQTAGKALKELLEGHGGTPSPEQHEAWKSALKVLSDRFRFVDSRLL